MPDVRDREVTGRRHFPSCGVSCHAGAKMIREKLEILMLLSMETTESSLIQVEKNFVKGIPKKRFFS